MKDVLQHILGKISSYNFFNNLFPGAVFCYLLKLLLNKDVFFDNLVLNLFLFYFVGMTLSRVGSLVVEPLLKKVRIAKKPLIELAPYDVYERASAANPFIVTLNEERNTYRTMLSCFVCLIIYKIALVANEKLANYGIMIINNNYDWIILIILMLLFLFSFVKQTNYVRKRVELIIKRIGIIK